MEKIQQHNKEYDEGKHTWYMGVNSLSDWTPEEFMNRNKLRKPQLKYNNPFGEIEASFASGEVKVPFSSIQAHEDDGNTHVYSYSAKRFENSTHQETETKFVADVIRDAENQEGPSAPSSIDWRNKVKRQGLA